MGNLDLAIAILSGKGQISKNDDIWQWIHSASSDPNTRNIVEIGTFNAGGSSRAIISGLRSNSGARAIGLETDWLLHKLADVRLRLKSGNRFRVMRGSLVDASAIDDVNLSKAEALWILKDIKTLSRAKRISQNLGNTLVNSRAPGSV
jgi:hypothetical protein